MAVAAAPHEPDRSGAHAVAGGAAAHDGGAIRTSKKALRAAAQPKHDAATAPRKAGKSDAGNKTAKPRKSKDAPATKLVRDRFTLPAQDHDLIKLMKQRAIAGGRPTRKSEVLRAGLQALSACETAELIASLDRLAPVRRKGSKHGKG